MLVVASFYPEIIVSNDDSWLNTRFSEGKYQRGLKRGITDFLSHFVTDISIDRLFVMRHFIMRKFCENYRLWKRRCVKTRFVKTVSTICHDDNFSRRHFVQIMTTICHDENLSRRRLAKIIMTICHDDNFSWKRFVKIMTLWDSLES